ncbi:DedA family protein [uncultured Paenibacillus sp.]|uniref:DedA family protein n=1 Tax=uncultured Paenibacillus sp. TaxID=227322 RepID=UPI0015AD87BD|nr:DedA family protein [uncultured Paenibacillus sp.]
METAVELVSQYGYLAILVLLALGIVGLPLPDETLMIFVGYLTSHQVLNFPLAVLFGFTGSILGMTVSYIVGKRIGYALFERFGKWIGLTPARYAKVRSWFSKYGIWTVLFAYFVPGVRHVAGYLSGINLMPFKKYLLICFVGAMFWTVLFITIGHFAGTKFLN